LVLDIFIDLAVDADDTNAGAGAAYVEVAMSSVSRT
jgi:hypothetical protein